MSLYYPIEWTALYSGMYEGDESLGVRVCHFILLTIFYSFMSNNNKTKQYIA